MYMKRNPNLKEKYLDAEMLFLKYWSDNLTIKLLTEWVNSNPELKAPSGKDATEMGIWKAIWRWASLKENKEFAWQIEHECTGIKREHWEWGMINRRIPTSWQFPTQKKKEKFLRENGWSE